jgi:cell division protein FtsI (penicillin-binding protein 3)
VNAATARILPAERVAISDAPTFVPAGGLDLSRQRLMMIMLLFMLMTAVISLRLIQLCLFGGGDGRAVATYSGDRGDIIDRNGNPLATTIKLTSIALNPHAVLGDKNKLAIELNRLMPDKSVEQYRAILFSRRKFLYLRHPADPILAQQVHALGEPGLLLLSEPHRLFPQSTLAGHVLGYSQVVEDAHSHKDATIGIGVERYFDDQLKGGKTVQLALDTRVQAALESEIARRMTETQAEGGAGIVMDVDTGEVIGMASLPDINPNAPLRSANDPNNHDMINKATLATYELGSTFKMLTFANALEHGVITNWGKTYDVSSPLHIGSHTIHDDEPKHRPLTIPEIMTFSSNIGTSQIAEEVGPDNVQALFRSMGLFEPTKIELRERGTPQLPRDWGRATVMTTSFGHGIAVTPLHLVQAYAALANGGIWHPATLLKHDPARPVEGKRVISAETSAKIRELMRLVVLQGTGTNADAPGLRVGGKTGTAEKIENGHYLKNSNITTFAAVFPMDHPRYVVLALLDDAKAYKGTYGFKTAGWMTAPLAKRIIARIGPLLGVQPALNSDVDVSELMPFIAEKKVPGKNVVE